MWHNDITSYYYHYYFYFYHTKFEIKEKKYSEYLDVVNNMDAYTDREIPDTIPAIEAPNPSQPADFSPIPNCDRFKSNIDTQPT